VFSAMASIPLLVIRGELSDILSEVTLGVMAQVHPEMTAVTVPDVGHAPLLREPECLAAIDAMIGRLIKGSTTVVRIR
jgi:pimeloyl-ACP methyl ester carboxylesterase